jgi:(p)ppGpp synthase/HD superfamily hydrolase
MQEQARKDFDSRRFQEAMLFAISLHGKQLRKKVKGLEASAPNIPYISHLLSVTGLALESGASENEAIAAMLHDAIEDGPACIAERNCKQPQDENGEKLAQMIRATLCARFGSHVLSIVEECSENKTIQHKPTRKKEYLKAFRLASREARLVMLCDKIHNAESIALDWTRHGEAVWTKFSLGKAASLAFYAEALEIARTWEPEERITPLINRFARTVDFLMRTHEKGEKA